jgi:hypothetical protein
MNATLAHEPTFVDPLPEVPAFLKNISNWIRWQLEVVNGRATKVPYRVDGRKAAATRPEDWADYQTAVTGTTIDSNGGVGFVVNGGIVGFDLDGCRNPETGEIAPWADSIVDALNCYTEYTPSGFGLRVWVRGELPGTDKVFNLDTSVGFGDKVKIEVFTNSRYFTVTGESYFEESGEVEERDLIAVYQMLHEIRGKHPAPTTRKDSAADVGEATKIELLGTFGTNKYDIFMRGEIESREPFVLSNRIGRLAYPSQSEADLGFCTVLAIKYEGDAEKIDEEFRKSALYRPKWDRPDYSMNTIAKAVESAGRIKANSVPVLATVENSVPPPTDESTDPIPPFDPSVMNGIYKKFVNIVTRGTTMAPQFVYAIAKTVVGARMAGKVKFENLDVEPRCYTALIGETGSGKGEAWRRVFQILNVEGQIGNVAGLKIINSADSGAGIRDLFFEPPESATVLMYIDEVESFGNKAAVTRNPAIMDMLIELADSTQISSVKASRGKNKGTKTKHDARLCAVMCGQEGSVYMKAFAGRTKLGLWDRLTPEYGVPVEAGDLPHISTNDAYELLSELNKLDYSGTMGMSEDGKTRLESFWSGQPSGVRKKARWKKNLTLDAYMSAFGRGVKVAEVADVEIAIRIFTRQLVIRQTHFTSEVPDRIGYYIGLLKAITAKMERQLAAGVPEGLVAKSRRDFERESHAHRDNESHLFEKAWQVYSPTWLEKREVTKANGQKYWKYLPATDE